MNFLIVALVSVILATGVFNTETKDSKGNKKTEIIVKESSETKPTEEEIKAEAEAQTEAEAKAAAEEINYLKIALYIVLLLAVLSGALLYFRKRDKSPLESKIIPPEQKEQEQPIQEKIQPETKEQQPIQEETQPETKEEQPIDNANKETTNFEETNEDEKK